MPNSVIARPPDHPYWTVTKSGPIISIPVGFQNSPMGLAVQSPQNAKLADVDQFAHDHGALLGAISLVRLKPREIQAALSKNGAEFLGVSEKNSNSSLNSQNLGLVAAGERPILQRLLIEEEKKKVPWTALGSLNPVNTMKNKPILDAD
jgi:hypothetical protein